MDIDYYKKVNRKISMKLIFEDGLKKKIVFAPKQSARVSEYNSSNEDFKVYDPIEKKTFVFSKDSKIESETISCPLPLINQLEDEYENVELNNENFSTICKNIQSVIDRTEKTESNCDYLKSIGHKISNFELLCMKTIDEMCMFGVSDILSFVNNTEENLSKCKENWKNKIIQKANESISMLEVEKKSFDDKNDLESSEEISIIIEMIENVKQEVSDESYFSSSKNTDDLIKKWPPILLPIPTE